MKYITAKIDGLESPFLFPDFLSHSQVARMVSGEIISAGFATHDFRAYGESVSLNVKSRPEEDTKLIRRAFDLDQY